MNSFGSARLGEGREHLWNLNLGSVRQSLTSRIFFHQLTDHHTKEERNSNEIRNRLREYNKGMRFQNMITDYKSLEANKGLWMRSARCE